MTQTKDPTARAPHKIDPRRFRHTEPVKLKDKPGKGGVFYNLEATFGFLPQWIAVTKVLGDHDKYILSAEIPDTMWAEMEKKAKSTIAAIKKFKNPKSPLVKKT